MKIMTESGRFRPEFLARITEIIPFAPINENMAEKIFSIQLKSLIKALSRLGIDFSISDKAIKNLALNGFSSKCAPMLNPFNQSKLPKPKIECKTQSGS